MLAWARGQGCEWDARTTASAAAHDHVECLQWLRAQEPPCPWDERLCDWAIHNGSWAAVRWARSQGCPSSPEAKEQWAAYLEREAQAASP